MIYWQHLIVPTGQGGLQGCTELLLFYSPYYTKQINLLAINSLPVPSLSRLIGQKSEQIQASWQTQADKLVVRGNASFPCAPIHIGLADRRQLLVFSEDFMISQDKYMRKWLQLPYPVFLQTTVITSISCEALLRCPRGSFFGCFFPMYRMRTWHLTVNQKLTAGRVRLVRILQRKAIVNTQGARQMEPRRVLHWSRTKG